MSEPIILDTNVLMDIARGNKPAADALRRYRAAGTEVYVSRAAYDELVTRAKTPQLGGSYREILSDLKIAIAPAGKMTDRLNVLADNVQHAPGPKQPGQMREYDRKNDPTKPGDAFVAAQTKAVGGRLWTLDANLAKRAPQFGVQLAPECSIKGMSGPEDPSRARQLLGMNPKVIGANGQVVPPSGGPGGSTGGYAVGVADNIVPEVGGPSARGMAKIGGIQLAFEGVNFVLNLINDHLQKVKIDQALDAIRPEVGRARAANPRWGVVLLFQYTQVQPHPDSIVKPGPVFHHVIWGRGATRDEAVQDATRMPTIRQGTAAHETSFAQEVWIPPLQKASVTTARSPFPPIAVGRFQLTKSNEAIFQLVSFNFIGGFDDIVEKKVKLPPGTNADFVVLKTPSEVAWYNKNGRQMVAVPVKESNTANGNTLKVVDLDAWSPFSARAAMVFPVDDWTEEVFSMAGPTEGFQQLGTYTNFRMVRWVRPENIHLLRFL